MIRITMVAPGLWLGPGEPAWLLALQRAPVLARVSAVEGRLSIYKNK